MSLRIIDSSLLIEADYRKVLKALAAYLQDSRSVAPPRVYEETVTEPSREDHLKASADRIRGLFSSGTIIIECPDYSEPRVSRAVDDVRKCMAGRMKKREDLVELADLQIVALAVAHAARQERVEVIFHDKILRDCLESVLPAHGIPGIVLTDSTIVVQEFRSKK